MMHSRIDVSSIVQKKILIIEDEATTIGTLEGRLQSRGYAPIIVRHTGEILPTFEAERPDMVLISLTLTDGSGVDVCRSIRVQPLGALIPIILMGSGSGGVTSAQDAIDVGADNYFSKSEQMADLLAKVVNYMGPSDSGSPIDSAFETKQSDHLDDDDGIGEWAALGGLLRQGEPEFDGADESEDVHGATLDGAPSLVRSMLEGDDRDNPSFLDAAPELAPTPQPTTPGETLPPLIPNRDHFKPPRAPTSSVKPPAADVLQSGRPISLLDRGVERALVDIAAEGLTGRLEIASGGVLRRIFFDGGAPVYADSSASAEDLAAYLVTEGLVVSDVLQQARSRGEQVGVTAEEILIEAGLISAQDVHSTLKDHVIDRLFACFAIEDGDAVVIRGGPRPMDPIELGLSSQRIILDGIRRKFGRLRLYRVYGTASVVPTRTVGQHLLDQLVLRPEETITLNQCDGRRSALEIARGTNTGEVDTLAILYGLLVLGLLQSEGTQTHVLAQVGHSAEQRALAPRTADQLPGYPELVQAMYGGVQSTDYFQILGVDRGATQAEIRAAFEDVSRRFDPHRVGRESPLWIQVKEISTVVDDAYRLLSNNRLRARYEAAIS